MSDAATQAADAHHGHHGSPFIQHHFDDAQHQFDSGKLGIWLFLVQEILFFSALFVAYIIYRAQHPEIFIYASHYLDTKMGAINTAVLILSSFTAAYAVRCAQLNQKRGLVACLAITIMCAMGFLGIKYVEYAHKYHIGTLWGAKFNPTEAPDGTPFVLEGAAAGGGAAAAAGSGAAAAAGGGAAAAAGSGAAAAAGSGAAGTPSDGVERPPPNTNMFFSIYFAMTGLHGIHVLVGVFIFVWLLWRAVKGHFTPDYYGPIDYAALYWHLVDLIWIFLFPMLYLID